MTFEELPQAMAELLQRVKNIERLLLMEGNDAPEVDKLLNVEECAEFLTLSKQTIYGLTAKSEIPHMKRGKRLYFSKLELIEYILNIYFRYYK